MWQMTNKAVVHSLKEIAVYAIKELLLGPDRKSTDITDFNN